MVGRLSSCVYLFGHPSVDIDLFVSQSYPASSTTLHFEFYTESKEEKSSKKVCFLFTCVFYLLSV